MKIQFRFVMVLTALIMIAGGFPAFTVRAEEEDILISGEAPMFSAAIEYSFEGYVVKGSFTEFISGISHIEPLYSLDGEIWQTCGTEWDLQRMGTEDPAELAKLQNQICLYDSFEPLKSYLAGGLDRFYLKLRLTRENGIIYETQVAVIERGTLQPIPEGITYSAAFDSFMSVFEKNPFCYYGRYQLTVNEDATEEDVSALLPDTLPIEVQLQKGGNFIAKGIVDCPVIWKPLSLPKLVAGESVTIPDAAEELIVPAGILVSTPIGVFQLEAPLRVAQDAIITDEVRLVLSVIPESERSEETLPDEISGGAGGNEGNAGTDNKKDSTDEGQRPNLPYDSENKPEEQQPNLSHNSENQPEGQQPDSPQNAENASEASSPSGTSWNSETDYDNPKSRKDMTPAHRFEDSVRFLTAEAVADICTSVVVVRIRANIISGRTLPQIVRILKWEFYNKFSTLT